jgi:hypothetical protein
MHTRIPVPLDGSAPASAGANFAFDCYSSDPSIVSSLVDGLEAETQTYSTAIMDGVQCEGIQTFSLIDKSSTAEAILAVADAITVNRSARPKAVPADNAG